MALELKDLTTAIGVEFGEDTTIEQATELINNSIVAKLHNDPEYFKTISKDKLPKELFDNERKAALGEARKMLPNGFGLKEEDYKHLLEETSLGAFTKGISEVVTKKLSKLPPDVAAMQTENLQLKDQLEKLGNLAEIEANITAKLQSDFDLKLTKIETERSVLQEYSTLTENILGNASFVFKPIFDTLNQKYALVAADGVLSLRDKTHTSFAALGADKKELTIKSAIELELRANGIWKDAAGTPPPPPQVITHKLEGSVVMGSTKHIEDIEANVFVTK
jgi:hypothetical protein